MAVVFCISEVQLYVNKSGVGGAYPAVVSLLDKFQLASDTAKKEVT